MGQVASTRISQAITVVLVSIAVVLVVDRILGARAARVVPVLSIAKDNRIDPAVFYALRSEGQSLGPADAPVQLVVFESFSCGVCAQYWAVLDSIRERYPDQLAVVVRSFVSNMDRGNGAIMVHLAAECAADQGKFDDFRRAAFAEPKVTQAQNGWEIVGKAIRMPNFQEFESCTKSHIYLARLKRDAQIGKSLGIPGTPTNFLNGRAYGGTLSLHELDSLVGEILRTPLDY